MKFHQTRHTLAESKCEIEMTPTLDIIFQMLIFFILSFRPVTDEGQFGVTMSHLPAGASELPTAVPGLPDEPADTSPDISFIPPLRVGLAAGPGGQLAAGGVVLGDRALQSMDYLEFELSSIVRRSGEDYEVIIEVDPKLQYQYVVQAVNAITHAGIKKINFGTPAPKGSE